MISYVHCYVNSRPNVDWNTCGQAAIATISDYWGKDPYGLPRSEYDPRDERHYWDDGQAIDAIVNGGLGPDVVFGWGTTGGRIVDALRSYGLYASVGYSGFFSSGWENLWHALQNYLNYNHPVPVLVDVGALGGPWWLAHWAIAYRILDGRVWLGACPWNGAPHVNQFLSAWHCWYLPYGFNHCAVYC